MCFSAVSNELNKRLVFCKNKIQISRVHYGKQPQLRSEKITIEFLINPSNWGLADQKHDRENLLYMENQF